jgi:hypothetical protein
MSTITKTIMLTIAAFFLAYAGALSAAEAPQHGKGQHHQRHRHIAENVSAQHKGAVQCGNNTRDNSYGGVYGEDAFKGD